MKYGDPFFLVLIWEHEAFSRIVYLAKIICFLRSIGHVNFSVKGSQEDLQPGLDWRP